MYALKRQEREEITERTRLMTVPLSVSNISGTAFVSATSAVRSHGHRRRYLKKKRKHEEREKELQLQFVSDGEEKIKRRNAMNAFRTTHKKRKKKRKKKTKKNRKKNLTRRPNGSCSDTETAEENRTKDTSIRKSFS